MVIFPYVAPSKCLKAFSMPALQLQIGNGLTLCKTAFPFLKLKNPKSVDW